MTERPLKPFWLVHRGHVACHGVLFEAEQRLNLRRLAHYYRAGSKHFRLGDGSVVVLFAQPELSEVALVQGAVLVRYGECYSALPLTARDIEALAVIGPLLVDATGGLLRQRPLEERCRIDPGDWYDLGEFGFELATPLIAPTSPDLAISAPPSNHRDALEHAIGERPPEADLFDPAGASARAEGTENPGAFGIRGTLALAFRQIAQRLALVLKRFIIADGAEPGGAPPALQPRRTDQRQSTTLRERLNDWMRHWIWRSLLGQLLGAAHSRYLGRMLEMFERGDLEEALRHAIPTSKVPRSPEQVRAPTLLPSAPRKALELGTVRQPAGTLVLENDLFAHLRATYERAFSRLVERGQIAEAAFVLSELLEDDARAVKFLESHGRFRQAAKLAELRKLPPGFVVRQWFLAGDRERAIAIARRDGAFEDAILRLNGRSDAQAALRLLWADSLAASGNFTGAVLALREVAQGRALAKTWLDQAVELGGVAGAQALGLRACLYSEDFERTREQVLALLSDVAADAPASRVALARELARGRDGGCTALARGVVRALIRDAADSFEPLPRQELIALARFSQDGALQADLPELPDASAPARTVEIPQQVLARQGDRGTARLIDVCALPRGRFLVARGEAGCSLIGPTGKVLHHFDVPCESLVMSIHGDRALALARRNDIVLVSRIALSSKECAEWCSLQLTAHAASFDGSVWYVAMKDRVCALDATLDRVVSLWCSATADAPIAALFWSADSLTFATRAGECWVHKLRPHRLTQRVQMDEWPVLGEKGVIATLCTEVGEGVERWALKEPAGARRVLLGATHGIQPIALQVSSQCVALIVDVPIEVPRAVDIKLVHLARFRLEAQLRLEGASTACARLDPHLLVVADDCGRVISLDLATLKQRANLRL